MFCGPDLWASYEDSILMGVSLIEGGGICLLRLDSQSVKVMETGCCFYMHSRVTKITLLMHVYM